jgi:phage terminase Nu1 subunit (DNA packaging protein)
MNINECAKLVNLSVATVKKYVKQGMPVEKDGTFAIAEVAKWIAENGQASHLKKSRPAPKKPEPKAQPKPIKQPKSKAAPPPEPPEDDLPMSMAEAKTRNEIAKALLAELNLAKEMEQVANIDDLMDEFSQALVTVRASLSSMSSRLAGILAHQDEHQVRKLIENEVAVMLTGLCKYDR